MVDTPNDSIPEYSGKWWNDVLNKTEVELQKKWWQYADRIISRYLDDRDEDNQTADVRRYNIFWANVQIMMAALYATPPKPTVKRQNEDSKDDVARVAAMILERLNQFEFNKDGSSMHTALRNGVEDRLVPGMGQVWLRYDAEILDNVVVKETAPCDYVHYRDFIWSPSRTWEEVWWVARRCWLKKKTFIKLYGKEKYDDVKQGHSDQSLSTKDKELPAGFKRGRVEVFEVWCEDTNKVYFINRHCEEALKEVDDPLKLDDFFPCPRPLFATVSTRNLIPRADYSMVRDQYEELDLLNDRIAVLTKALRVVGAYDGTNTALKNMLSGPEFAMIPVDNWESFSEKGGLAKVVDWFPVEVIAEVLMKLVEQRALLVGQIYELTSISDIMRGASSPRETAKAQTLKAQYSSVRLQLTQQTVARWVTDAIRIRSEIMCKHFSVGTIAQISQIEQTESAMFAQPAIALLKDYNTAEYRIDIGEETLSLADYNAEREMRTEYLTAVGQYISQAGMILEQRPDAMPFLLRMVQWVTASFKGSADMETVLDEAIKTASQPLPEKDDGSAAKAQAEMQIAQMDERMQLQRAQMQEQGKQQADQVKLQIAELNAASKEAIATANNETKHAIEQMKLQLEMGAEEGRQAMDDVMLRLEAAKITTDAMLERESQSKQHEHEESIAEGDHAAAAATSGDAKPAKGASQAAAAAPAPAAAPITLVFGNGPPQDASGDANNEAVAAALTAVTAAMASIQKSVTADKSVVRDKSGKITRVKTELN